MGRDLCQLELSSIRIRLRWEEDLSAYWARVGGLEPLADASTPDVVLAG